ncbi:MAG TPA: hypothetical protein PKD79_00180 [Candidatus Doudnabacteria bacterium]|nr:hypothetical protein [Candidatus Doudnabacteria bacterium]
MEGHDCGIGYIKEAYQRESSPTNSEETLAKLQHNAVTLDGLLNSRNVKQQPSGIILEKNSEEDNK